MAYRTGTASSYTDLWNQFIDFITADPELVADGENWSIVFDLDASDSNSPFNTLDSNSLTLTQYDGIVLKGPGLSATDEVFVGMYMTALIGADQASIFFRGMSNINPDAQSVWDHINVQPFSSALFLRANNSMDFWFSANGRRFIIGVRCSTVYEVMYAGLFLPYVLPAEYPYPLFVGGMGLASLNWQSTSTDHANFVRSVTTSANGHYMLDPSGTWVEANAAVSSDNHVGIGPWDYGNQADGSDFYNSFNGSGFTYAGYSTLLEIVTKGYGDEWLLTPVTLGRWIGADAAYGALDGFYHIGGKGQTVENVVTVDGLDYIVMQDAFRTSQFSYCAFILGVPGSNS